MIDFFTDPYKDELIYSAIARYHFYSGNVDYRDTIEECFGKRTMVPTLELGGRLDYLANELGGKYTAEKIINNNTIFPYYAPFMDEKRKDEILSYIKFRGSSSIYTKLGIVAGSVCKKDFIYYCSICSSKEIEQYGEVYIHREHQLQGIIVCPHHSCLLKRYSIRKLDSSKIEYIKLENELLKLEISNEKISNYEKHLKLSKDAYYLFNGNIDRVNKENLLSRYRYFLYDKGLARNTGTIKQRALYEEFINYYGIRFLKELESDIDFDNEYNWLKVVTRNSKRATHPVRHLLLIGFLCEDIEKFFEFKLIDTNKKIIKKKYNMEDANLYKMSEYKKTLLSAIKDNKKLKRTELREKLKKEYTYLYRYDNEWLFNTLPKKAKIKQKELKIDWKERDNQYLKLLIKKYNELNSLKKPVRITIASLAKSLGILVNIQKKINKFPMTREFLDKVCESTEEFQLRRCKWAVDNLIKSNDEVKLWKVQRIAAIRTKQFECIRDNLIRYINEKDMRGYNGEN